MQYNINSFIISNKQIQKKAKLFRQSVQLIERQVFSTELVGYKREFLIWSWGLKNKVFLSMNFMTNFGLTSNTKSCAIFNSECMLVFAACSLLTNNYYYKFRFFAGNPFKNKHALFGWWGQKWRETKINASISCENKVLSLIGLRQETINCSW